MDSLRMISKILILVLIFIALTIAFIVYEGRAPWILIAIYWFVLTAKNFVDWLYQTNEDDRSGRC